MDVLDRLRLRQDEKIVVALQMALASLEAVAAEMLLRQAEALDLRAHCAVENEDAFARGPGKRREGVIAGREGSAEKRCGRVIHGPSLPRAEVGPSI